MVFGVKVKSKVQQKTYLTNKVIKSVEKGLK